MGDDPAPKWKILLLMAIQEVRHPNWYEERFGPPVYGFEYDGTSLTPKAWKIEDKDTKAYIDPQFFENQMWYISFWDIWRSSQKRNANARTFFQPRSNTIPRC